MMNSRAGRGDESLGLLDRRDDRCRRRVDDGSLIAVHLLGGEDRRCAGEEAGGRLRVTGLRIGGELKLLVEDDEGGFLALADLSAGLGPLLVGAPGAGAVTEFLGIGPERHDVDAAIGLLRGDVDGPHDVAGGAMPGQPEVSRAALDRAHDLVGDVLVNVEAFVFMEETPHEIWARLLPCPIRDCGWRPASSDFGSGRRWFRK